MKLSSFGKKFSGPSAIVSLMDDLGEALTVNPNMIFMGGGNPSRIPQVEEIFRDRLMHVLNDADALHQMMGVYQSPQGNPHLLKQIAEFLNKQFGWSLSSRNIAISNGSQSAFFVLFNLFAGRFDDGTEKKIQLPMAPEYLGYGDVGLSKDFFVANRPSIELLDDNLFKYHVDFEHLRIGEDIGALCVSRPTNPTGNVLTDDEMLHLDQLARQHQLPLIIDGAYGTPFPNIIFTQALPLWNDNIILTLSLSKLGLPGARTGIVVASEEVIQAYTHANTILTLGCGNMGPAIVGELIQSGDIVKVGRELVRPFYQQRAEVAVASFKRALNGLPYRIHKPEGAIFLWLWFEGLPITAQLLYRRLKARGVLVIAGHHFFLGLKEEWAHKHECIRVTYAQDPEKVQQGIEIIAEEVRKAYEEIS